jgi:hypothetical protein
LVAIEVIAEFQSRGMHIDTTVLFMQDIARLASTFGDISGGNGTSLVST